eukprot:scaffold6707_cov99-Skeletonema_marinoi.AAC.2
MELEAPPVPWTPLCCIFPGPRGPMKTYGGSSDDAIDDMVLVFIEKNVYNFSGDWRCNKIRKIGSDGNKGAAAGVCGGTVTNSSLEWPK